MMQDMMMKEMGGDVGKDGAGSEKAYPAPHRDPEPESEPSPER